MHGSFVSLRSDLVTIKLIMRQNPYLVDVLELSLHGLGEQSGLGMNVFQESLSILARTKRMWFLKCLMSSQSVRLSDILGSREFWLGCRGLTVEKCNI